MEGVTPLSHPNPWVPERDPQNIKVLGKLIEEFNEGGSAAARCIIQGIDEREPVTGKPNRRWLEDEIADAEANIELTKRQFTLDRAYIEARAARKLAFLTSWLEMLAPETEFPEDPTWDLAREEGTYQARGGSVVG